jgi:cyclopropane fatty-acyl-phospholipid synthase-like methyltransferase
MPISDVLLQEGLVVFGIDASPKMVAAFRARFPETQCECNTVESSNFFNRTFDAVIAWGLIFLLPPSNQTRLIHKVAGVLKRGGQFVFTAPSEVCQWSDNLTGLTSFGLGSDSYKRELESAGFEFIGDRTDEGNNYYYISRLAQ